MIKRYTLPEMGRIWSLENKFRAWLQVEIAICEAWHTLERIPAEEMRQIREHADFDLDRILELEEQSKHDVIAFLSAVEEKLGPAARYIHLGCTSSDIVDTANSLLLLQAAELIQDQLQGLLQTLQAMARSHQGLICMGRTHGVHAEPTSMGLKFAGFFAELARQRKRLESARAEMKTGKISGAVGTFAHLSPKVEEIACSHLGLEPDPISTQVIQRDRYANFFSVLAQIAGSIERLATELRHLQRTEVLEVEEGFAPGQKGSSAMPHKKNPISAENLCGLARLVRSNSLAALEDMALWHERDISHSSVERVIMPDSTILVHYMLHRMNGVLQRLQINQDRLEQNLYSSFGLFFSQRVLLRLIDKGCARQQAYELVQRLAMQAWEEKRSFEELVRGSAGIKEQLQEQDLKDIFDPGYYLQHEETILERSLRQ
ncbi:MAG: adenylosuccinate lyase [Thermodesulfobacteriota bacterium]